VKDNDLTANSLVQQSRNPKDEKFNHNERKDHKSGRIKLAAENAE